MFDARQTLDKYASYEGGGARMPEHFGDIQSAVEKLMRSLTSGSLIREATDMTRKVERINGRIIQVRDDAKRVTGAA